MHNRIWRRLAAVGVLTLISPATRGAEPSKGSATLPPMVKVSGQAERLTLNAPEVSGEGVDPDALARFETARKSALDACYEKELKGSCFEGTAVVKFTITPQARAAEVDVTSEGFTNEPTLTCFRQVLKAWVFPFKPAHGVKVVQRVTLSPLDERGNRSTCARGGSR